MEQREKLIELIGKVQYLGGLEGKLADHLLANGVVALPCKVGDTVYVIDATRVYLVSKKISQLRIAEIIYTDRGIYVMGEHGEGEYALNECYLTKDEAEKALVNEKAVTSDV